ncbi:MAG TPA: hypothetical protein VIA06_10605 [Candidatus Dormibacteraeota bacterium]|jgi:hypothetical protein|nr:hypothetical protein [Candidatus Dormibacteraeota bacterium]
MTEVKPDLFGLDSSSEGANLARELAVVGSELDGKGLRPLLRVSAIQRAAQVIWGLMSARTPTVRAANETEQEELRRRGLAGQMEDAPNGRRFRFDSARPLPVVLNSPIQARAYEHLSPNTMTLTNRDDACAALADAWVDAYAAESAVIERSSADTVPEPSEPHAL